LPHATTPGGSDQAVVTAGVEYQRPTFLMLQSRYFAEEDGVIAGFERLVTAADQLCDGAAHDREPRKLFERLEPHVNAATGEVIGELPLIFGQHADPEPLGGQERGVRMRCLVDTDGDKCRLERYRHEGVDGDAEGALRSVLGEGLGGSI